MSPQEHLDLAIGYRKQAAEAQTFAYDNQADYRLNQHGWNQANYYNAAAQAEAIIAVATALVFVPRVVMPGVEEGGS